MEASVSASFRSRHRFYKVIAIVLAGTFLSRSVTAETPSWQINKPTLLQWYGIGFAAKLIMNYVTESLERSQQEKIATQFKHDEPILTEQERKQRLLNDHAGLDEFKARMDTAEKIIETTLQKSAGALYGSQGASDAFVSSITNAYEAGEKWSLLSKVAKNIPLLELVRTTVYDETARNFFELTPVKSHHTTTLYCGPQDSHCLHGPQPELAFTDALKDTMSMPLFSIIMNIAVGVTFSNLGYHLGKTTVTATSALSKNILLLAKDYGISLLVSPQFATLFQKGMARYIEVKTLNELKRLFMNMIGGIDFTHERVTAEKKIKWGSQAKIIEAQTIPTYQKFLDDLTQAT